MEDNVVIMPADWGPTDVDVDVGGVEDIADRDNKDELIEKYEEELDDVMFQYFNVEELASSLKDNGHSLRRYVYVYVYVESQMSNASPAALTS